MQLSRQLPLFGRSLLSRIVVDAHIGDVTFAAPNEEVLVKIERQREDAHKPSRQRFHAVPILADGATEFGAVLRPQVRMGVNGPKALGPVGIVVGF